MKSKKKIQLELKPLTEKEKQADIDSLNEIVKSIGSRKRKPVLNNLTDEYADECIDKLLDVLADIQLVENDTVRSRIRKICYAIIRIADSEKYEHDDDY